MSRSRTELIYQTQNYIAKAVEKFRKLNQPIFISQEKLFNNLNIDLRDILLFFFDA